MPVPLLSITGGSLVGKSRSGPVALTGSGALRAVPFDGAQGWFVEEATSNLVLNPSVEVDVANIENYTTNGGTVTIARVPTATPQGAYAVSVTSDGTGQQGGSYNCNLAGVAGATLVGSVWVWGTGNLDVYVRAWYSDGTSDLSPLVKYTATPTPTRVITQPMIVSATKTVNKLHLTTRTSAPQAVSWSTDGAQVETKPYATTYCDGSLGPGYAWTGTAHASASTRAASGLRLADGAAYIGMSGAIYTRLVVTPSAYSGVGFAYRIGSSNQIDLYEGSASVLSARFANETGTITTDARPPDGAILSDYVDWTPIAIRHRTTSGVPASTTRSSPGPLPTGDIFFGASNMASGTYWMGAIGPVLIYDRPLTDAERATLDATPTALLGWDTLIPRVSGIASLGMGVSLGVMLAGMAAPLGIRRCG